LEVLEKEKDNIETVGVELLKRCSDVRASDIQHKIAVVKEQWAKLKDNVNAR